MIDIVSAAEAIGGAATAIGSTWAAIKHIQYNKKFKKEKERQEILSKASEEMAKIEVKLNVRINQLEIELEAQKLSVSTEFVHVKDTYNSEIRVLGQRIQELRQDLADQHSSMIQLLTRLVGSK
jgi:predicted RNase H-like nuclease (RuvC/YqgF family)